MDQFGEVGQILDAQEYFYLATNYPGRVEGLQGGIVGFAGFDVTITDIQTSVTEQFLDVTLRLVSHDFHHKMWNKASEFDIFIQPKKNIAKRLQKGGSILLYIVVRFLSILIKMS